MSRRARTRAVFFDVDFTLIYPGPTFQGEGYARFCAEHGITVDQSRFPEALRAASALLVEEEAGDDRHVYDPNHFVRFTRRIIEEMGGTGPRVQECARHVYDQWAACQYFHLYDDAVPAIRALEARGVKIGLISNTHRCLQSFQRHFGIGEFAAAVSSSDHGYMKPHPSIFEAALEQAGVAAEESMMVGDSLPHDIEGALRVGMAGVLVHRADGPPPNAHGVPVIRSLRELPDLLG